MFSTGYDNGPVSTSGPMPDDGTPYLPTDPHFNDDMEQVGLSPF